MKDMYGAEITLDSDENRLYIEDGIDCAAQFQFHEPDEMYALADLLCARADDWRDEIHDYYLYGDQHV